jgi:hypothetical protein
MMTSPAHRIARVLLLSTIRAKNEYVQERKTTQLPTQSLGLIKEMESRTQKSRRRVVTCQALTKEALTWWREGDYPL